MHYRTIIVYCRVEIVHRGIEVYIVGWRFEWKLYVVWLLYIIVGWILCCRVDIMLQGENLSYKIIHFGPPHVLIHYVLSPHTTKSCWPLAVATFF